MLRRRVAAHFGAGAQRRDGRDHHDRTFALDQAGQGSARRHERGIQIGIERALPRGVVGLQRRPQAMPACASNEDVDAAEVLLHLRDGLFHVGVARCIADDGEATNLLSHARDRRLAPAHQGDSCAERSEMVRTGGADARPAAGDERDPPMQSHVASLAVVFSTRAFAPTGKLVTAPKSWPR
jgi:hypothetical protein